MEIRLSKKVATAIGLGVFRRYTKNEESWQWKRETHINLAEMGKAELDAFEKIFLARPEVPGVRLILKDLTVWRAALAGGTKAKATAVRHFKPLLVGVLAKVSGHRIYRKLDGERDVWLAYYANEVEYHPEVRHRDGRAAPLCSSCALRKGLT